MSAPLHVLCVVIADQIEDEAAPNQDARFDGVREPKGFGRRRAAQSAKRRDGRRRIYTSPCAQESGISTLAPSLMLHKLKNIAWLMLYGMM